MYKFHRLVLRLGRVGCIDFFMYSKIFDDDTLLEMGIAMGRQQSEVQEL